MKGDKWTSKDLTHCQLVEVCVDNYDMRRWIISGELKIFLKIFNINGNLPISIVGLEACVIRGGKEVYNELIDEFWVVGEVKSNERKEEEWMKRLVMGNNNLFLSKELEYVKL